MLPPPPPSHPPRLPALDQFRGYTVAGMFLVNFLGGVAAVPALLKHHNTYCSYADTIMPHFFFCMGFAMRLSLLRRAARTGPRAARGHALWRAAGLVLIGMIVYHLDGKYGAWAQLRQLTPFAFVQQNFRSSVFQTLVHLALTSVWVLPVILRSSRVRIGFMLGSAALHLALSRAFYFDWALAHGAIDGGPLGFLTWTLPVLCGSLAHDALAGPRPLRRLALWGAVLMLAGYALACGSAWAQGGSGVWRWLAAPPFLEPRHARDVWTMSQKTGAVSYQAFGAGLSLALFALFAWACGRRGWRLPLFTTLGLNALAGYLLHSWVGDFIDNYMPDDSPLAWALLMFALYFGLCWLLLRGLQRQGIVLKL